MRKRTRIAAVLCVLVLLLTLSQGSFAAGLDAEHPSGDAEVSAQIPGVHRITLAQTDAQVYRDGKAATAFTIDRLTAPRLLIAPAANTRVSRVLLDETDVTDRVIGGYLTLDPVTTDHLLTIETESVPEETQVFHRIEGVLMADGKPLAGATVELHSTIRTCVTDADGRFAFEDVENGHHTLTVLQEESVIGYLEFQMQNGEETQTSKDSAGLYTLQLPEGKQLLKLSVDLSPDGTLGITEAVAQNDVPVWLIVLLAVVVLAGAGCAFGIFRKRKRSARQ